MRKILTIVVGLWLALSVRSAALADTYSASDVASGKQFREERMKAAAAGLTEDKLVKFYQFLKAAKPLGKFVAVGDMDVAAEQKFGLKASEARDLLFLTDELYRDASGFRMALDAERKLKDVEKKKDFHPTPTQEKEFSIFRTYIKDEKKREECTKYFVAQYGQNTLDLLLKHESEFVALWK